MVQPTIEVIESKRGYKVLSSIIFLVFGILLLIFQRHGLAFVALLLGIALLIMAVVYFIQYLNGQRVDKTRLMKCIIALVFGILLLIFRVQVASILLPVLIAIGILALAVMCAINAINYKKLNIAVWWMPLIGTIIAVIVSILIFCNLYATSNLVAIIIGLFLVVFGALSLFEFATVRSLIKRF